MDLTLHLTTRADDSHATPVLCFYQRSYLQLCFIVCQEWVRFCACRIKPHAPPLVWVPVNSFKF